MAQPFRLCPLCACRGPSAFARKNVPRAFCVAAAQLAYAPLTDGPRTLRVVAFFPSVAQPLWVSSLSDPAPPTRFRRTAMRPTLNAVVGTAATELLKERVRALVASLDDSHEWARFVPGADAVCEPHIRVCESLRLPGSALVKPDATECVRSHAGPTRRDRSESLGHPSRW